MVGVSRSVEESRYPVGVQLGLPFARIADAEIPPTAVEPIAPIYFVRHRRARRYLLRVEH